MRAILPMRSSLSKNQGALHTVYVMIQEDMEFILGLLEQAPEIYAYVDVVGWDYQINSNDWHERAARRLALKLNRTRELYATRSNLYDPDNHLSPTLNADAFFSIFPTTHITSLYLSGAVFRSTAHYLRSLHAFSALEVLHCEGSLREARDVAGEIECYLLSAPPLRQIYLSHNNDMDEVTVKWLSAQSNPLQLETASFYCGMLASINDLLRRCAPTITSLEITRELINVRYGEYSYHCPAAAAENSADLSSCTSLRQLKLHHSEVSSVTQVLRTVQHKTLRRLDLYPSEGTAEDWAELSLVLMRPRFALLNTLHVEGGLFQKEHELVLDTLKPLEKMAAFRLHRWVAR
jgi:hypothetical protein